MKTWKTHRIRVATRLSLAALLFTGISGRLMAQPVVPGSGHRVEEAGDDFEDPNWEYYPNGRKSSFNVDKNRRLPRGRSSNGLWIEGRKRGHPDVVKRVDTPAGGLPGSKGAMLMKSLYTGIPGRPSYRFQQDDFIVSLTRKTGAIPVSWNPSVVVRVYLPSFDKWERVHGTSFGMRGSIYGRGPYIPDKPQRGFRAMFSRRGRIVNDKFYPGFFIQFIPGSERQVQGDTEGEVKTIVTPDSAVLLCRANERMQDIEALKITETGWWTLGMSFTPDGRVHYYASPGVDDLTEEDHLASFHSQGVRAQRFNTVFFNIVNQDNGRDWSTEWIIDDPSMYYISDEDRQLETARKPRSQR